MKYALIKNNVVELISYEPTEGFVEVNDNVFADMIKKPDGSFNYSDEFLAEQEQFRLEQEQIRLQKEQEENEIKSEKERRIGITNILMSKILKISSFDNQARELKDILTPIFDNYNNLAIHYINLDSDDFEKVDSFIKKTRFTEQEKYDIYKIFI